MRRHKIQFEGLESEAFDEGLGGIWSYTDGAKLVLRQYQPFKQVGHGSVNEEKAVGPVQ